jgi:hypothetical protein
MIAGCWIFVAFALGGCAGLFLTALLRTAAEPDFDARLPAEYRKAPH